MRWVHLGWQESEMIRDESHLTVRPNVCSGERLGGRLATRGGAPVFLTDDGRVFPLEAGEPTGRGPARATVLAQHGEPLRACDVRRES